MCTKHVVLDELSKGPGRTTAQTKIRQPKNFRKVETATGRAEKCDTIFESHYRNTQICQNKHS